jgi:hypothetical protein
VERFTGLFCLLAAAQMSARAQARISAGFLIQPFDMQVLESNESRTDLPCQVVTGKPFLAFDLRFHAQYYATVPAEELRDAGGRLAVVLRVTPAESHSQPDYFVQTFRVPAVPSETRAEGEVTGGVELGYGHYKVDWMMRDAGDRVCSSHWEVNVNPRHGERNLPLTLAPNLVADRWGNTGGQELPVEPSVKPRRVKVLLNLSPASPQKTALDPHTAAVLLSILSGLAHTRGIDRLSLMAFNIWEQKIIARKQNAGMFDLAALAKAAEEPTNAIVDYRRLQEPQSEVSFLTTLLKEELTPRDASPDAIIVVGPKLTLPMKIPQEVLKESGAASSPIFYLNYNPDPVDQPWPDAIRSALKAYRGTLTYDVLSPKDLAVAMKDILSRIRALPAAAS